MSRLLEISLCQVRSCWMYLKNTPIAERSAGWGEIGREVGGGVELKQLAAHLSRSVASDAACEGYATRWRTTAN